MREPVSRTMCRLYGVSEDLNESGKYQLVPFDKKVFNRVVEEGKIEDKIFKITAALYGHGDGSWLHSMRSGTILSKNTFSSEVQNIVDLIDADPRHSLFYLAVNAQKTDIRWFVAVEQETIYEDED